MIPNQYQILHFFPEYCRTHPQMEPSDGLKFLFQSAFGCEHMVSSLPKAIEGIRNEAKALSLSGEKTIEPLEGSYSRLSLSCLEEGLSAETLGALFFLSARQETRGVEHLEALLPLVEILALSGQLPFDGVAFSSAREEWKRKGYPPLHHSDRYRAAYQPAYRVISNSLLLYLPALIQIDRLLKKGGGLIAIEGGSASGKTTFSALLEKIYPCTVLHTDDFFLQPHQRSKTRLQEIGGNLDRERFLSEALIPAKQKKPICYRRFDCQTGQLQPDLLLPVQPLTIAEGAYSLHPDLSPFYDLTIFLDISPDLQAKRIGKRNSPSFAERFFREWIPMENRYFDAFRIRERCDLILPISIDE